jgi:hypothetical protein
MSCYFEGSLWEVNGISGPSAIPLVVAVVGLAVLDFAVTELIDELKEVDK